MKEKTKILLYWFILLQPFLDLDFFYRGKLATILPFTIPTIIRIAGVIVLVGLLVWGQKQLPPAWLWACLLYTSPSPRDVEESRMPSSA